jgi:hypothetical protein
VVDEVADEVIDDMTNDICFRHRTRNPKLFFLRGGRGNPQDPKLF